MYEQHCAERNKEQAALMRTPTFPGVSPDPILQKLLNTSLSPPCVDTRNAISLWARPPPPIRALVHDIQQRLAACAPTSLWLMPATDLHLSVLEVTHHQTPEAVARVLASIEHALPELLAYPRTRSVRLSRPQLACDAGSLVLKFLPAAPSASSRELVEVEVSGEGRN